MRKPLLLVAGLLLGLLATTQPQARTLDEIMKAGVIRVGVNPTLPPLGKFDDKNQITGFDVDYATEVARMLGVKLEVQQVGSPDRIPFLVSGKIDFCMGALTRTPDRLKVIDFTLPVHTEVFGVLTTEGKPYKTVKDLDSPNVTLVQVRGTTPVKYIEENLKQAKIVLLDNYPDAVRALSQGRGDAMVDAVDFLGEQMARFKETKWHVLEVPVDIDYDALGVAKNATGLKDWLNLAVFELQRKGTTDALWLKWFNMKMVAPTGATPYF